MPGIAHQFRTMHMDGSLTQTRGLAMVIRQTSKAVSVLMMGGGVVLIAGQGNDLPGNVASPVTLQNVRAHAFGTCVARHACAGGFVCVRDELTLGCNEASAGHGCGNCVGEANIVCDGASQAPCEENYVVDSCCNVNAVCTSTKEGCSCIDGGPHSIGGRIDCVQ